MNDLEKLKAALLAPSNLYQNGKRDYEVTRQELIDKLGYDEFRELQKKAFKEILK